MAIRFKDLHGMSLKETYISRHGDGKPRVNVTCFAYEGKEYQYEILSDGDTFFMLDRQNNFEIVELIAKSVSICWDGKVDISACKSSDAEKLKGYMLYHYGNFKYNEYTKYIINIHVRGNRTHTGLFFTTRKEAEQYQKQLRNNIGFIFLNPGDIVYLVLDSSELMEAEVDGVRESADGIGRYFNLSLKDIGVVKFDQMRYEERVSELLETRFYTHDLNFPFKEGMRYYRPDVKIYIKKEDAEKSIKSSEKRKSRNATVKYLKSIENHDGKPISHTDKKGKQLHYGDLVTYAVSRGSSAPLISFGIVKGESKEKVSIVDEEKYRNGKEDKHSVSPGCILLIKEAEFNTTSGYSFVKQK